MACSTIDNVILLSIYPEYASAIIRGDKKVEFRKASICTNASHVLVYATSPHMRIVGFFEVRQVHRLSPQTLWRRFGKLGVIDEDDFFKYFEGHAEAIGLEVGKVWRFEKPLPLQSVRRGMKPPQAFSYVSPEVWRRLKRYSVQPVS